MNRNNSHIVIAVDGSENSRRAVGYVSGLLGGRQGFTATLLHVIHAPEEDFYFDFNRLRSQWPMLAGHSDAIVLLTRGPAGQPTLALGNILIIPPSHQK